MSTNVTQLKVTLPNPLVDFLSSRAAKFGLTLSAYVKNLIVNDVKDMDYPVFQASDQTEASYQQAIEEKGHATEVKDIETYFHDL